MNKIGFVIILVFLANVVFVDAQDDVRTPSGRPNPPTIEQVRNRNFDRRRADLARVSNMPRERSRERLRRLSKEERQKFTDATTPSDEDLRKYKDLGSKPNSGIFRMVSNYNCETENLIKVDGDCKGFVPGAWTYSFRQEDFADRVFHDLTYIGQSFVSRSLLTQSIMVDLGDSSFSNPPTDQLDFVLNFVPSEDKEIARNQFEEVSKGIWHNERLYSNQVGVKEGNTYLLRVIAYRFSDKWSTRLWKRNEDKVDRDEIKFSGLEFDNRIDATYVFKVVRKDDDQAITIIWRRLKKSKAPRLTFRKDEKLVSFNRFE